MGLSKKEAINFFNFLEKSSKHDNKITIEDLRVALEVDTDNDGKITDKEQTRILKDGTVTTWKETEVLEKNVNEWIKNAKEAGKWEDDNAIDLQEFLEMMKIN
jgi:Ca2+-binding EF-hand superfamily protein